MSPDVKTKSKRPARLPPICLNTVVAPMAPTIPLLPPRTALPPLEFQAVREIIQLPPMIKASVSRLAPEPAAPEPAAPATPLSRSLPPLSSPPPAPTKSSPKYNCYDMDTCNCKCNNPIHTRSNIALAKATKRGMLWGDMLDDWTFDDTFSA